MGSSLVLKWATVQEGLMRRSEVEYSDLTRMGTSRAVLRDILVEVEAQAGSTRREVSQSIEHRSPGVWNVTGRSISPLAMSRSGRGGTVVPLKRWLV